MKFPLPKKEGKKNQMKAMVKMTRENSSGLKEGIMFIWKRLGVN